MQRRHVTYVWKLKVWREDNGDWWLTMHGRWRRLRLQGQALRLVGV